MIGKPLSHQKLQHGRQDASEAGSHGADGQARVPHRGGEQFGRVDVDGAERGRDAEPPELGQAHHRPAVAPLVWGRADTHTHSGFSWYGAMHHLCICGG